jgi:hypothetical protein
VGCNFYQTFLFNRYNAFVIECCVELKTTGFIQLDHIKGESVTSAKIRTSQVPERTSKVQKEHPRSKHVNLKLLYHECTFTILNVKKNK